MRIDRSLAVACDLGHSDNTTTTTATPERKYPEIFEQSIVYVGDESDWTESDLERPENRVVVEDVELADISDYTLYDVIDASRTVDSSLLDRFPDFRDGMGRTEELRNFLDVVPSTSESTGISAAELRCYDSIFHKIRDGVIAFHDRQFDSAQMHTWFFASTMLQHPFLLDKHSVLHKVEMAAERTTGLYMFIKADDQAEIHKVSHQSNFVVLDKSSGLPILISEVDFPDSPRNYARTFLQGVVACRQWRYILPEPLKDKNMFLGLFVTDDFDVEFCLFHADRDYNVKVYHHIFLLVRKHEALQLSRILFNYRDAFSEIVGQLDEEKFYMLMKTISSEKIPPSVSPPPRGRLQSSSPDNSESDDSCTHPLLLSAEVKSLLCPEGTFLQGTKHENVAAVRMLAPPFKTVGFVKWTNRRELQAFDAIRKSRSKFLLDRIVLPTKVVNISGDKIAFLPYGGDPLEHSWGKENGPIGHEMEIAWDLLNIVSHLHEIHIVHMDIKPVNILWDTTTRSIRVIDFDSSAMVDPNGSRKIKGYLGTPGFMAPEVESGEDQEYDPFLADAFSCGMVVSDVALVQDITKETRFVRGLSKHLTEKDSGGRWSVNKAMETWADWLEEHGRPLYARD